MFKYKLQIPTEEVIRGLNYNLQSQSVKNKKTDGV
jgi:hypothetical protein